MTCVRQASKISATGLTYCGAELFTAVKSFRIQDPVMKNLNCIAHF